MNEPSAPGPSVLEMKRSSSVPSGLDDIGRRKDCSESANSSSKPRSLCPTEPSSSTLSANPQRRSSVAWSLSPASGAAVERTLGRLRRESSVKECIEGEYADERLFRSASAVSSSWRDFVLLDSVSDGCSRDCSARKRARSVCEPVHVLTNLLPASCSPSPTRNEKQCYSPSMQRVVREAYFSPSPSPSPTRRPSYLRSVSPIAVRPFKRIHEADGDFGAPAAKRPFAPLIWSDGSRSPSSPGVGLFNRGSTSTKSTDSDCNGLSAPAPSFDRRPSPPPTDPDPNAPRSVVLPTVDMET